MDCVNFPHPHGVGVIYYSAVDPGLDEHHTIPRSFETPMMDTSTLTGIVFLGISM